MRRHRTRIPNHHDHTDHSTWLRAIAAIALLCSIGLQAHPISMSTVVANVETNQVKVEMKILVEDLMLFRELQPNADQVLEAEGLRDASVAHHQFLLDYFQVRLTDGTSLSGTVTSTDTEEITDQGVALDAVMSTSVYYELAYELSAPPEYLTFSQNFGGPSNPLPAVMDLIVLQNSARLGYPVQIGPKTPHSVELDWENPPTNDRKSWRQRRELMKQRREELLGITSYSTTYSYIYITDTEIRHEILVPLLTLETWFPVNRSDPDFLEVAEQEAAIATVETYFAEHAPILIDGVNVPAQLDRVDFYGLDFRDFAKRSEKKRVGIHNARAGIILSYPTKQPPQSLQLTWDTFNQHTPLLNSVVFDHQKTGYRQFFTPAEPTFEWQAEETTADFAANVDLPQPPEQPRYQISAISGVTGLLSLALLLGGLRSRKLWVIGLAILFGAGAYYAAPRNWFPITMPRTASPTEIIVEESANRVFAALHGNIYRAFEYGQESQVYDVLSESVGGELLESLYLQIRNGLRMEEQGGAVARVTSTSIEDTELKERRFVDGRPVFQYRCTWNVAGTVEHWGHIHTRENQYQALFDVAGIENAWKITKLEVMSESRLGFKTGLREAK